MTVTQQGLEEAFTTVAALSLQNKNIKVTFELVDIESARIERCVEYYYKIDKEVVLDYPNFAGKFLLENFKEIIEGDKFSGLYIDDLPEGLEKECYLEELNVLA